MPRKRKVVLAFGLSLLIVGVMGMVVCSYTVIMPKEEYGAIFAFLVIFGLTFACFANCGMCD